MIVDSRNAKVDLEIWSFKCGFKSNVMMVNTGFVEKQMREISAYTRSSHHCVQEYGRFDWLWNHSGRLSESGFVNRGFVTITFRSPPVIVPVSLQYSESH